MTAQTPERDGGGETLGRIAYEAYRANLAEQLEWAPGEIYAFSALRDAEQAAWTQIAEAVAAHVVDPTAADYDHAAETTRLEGEIARLNGLLRDDRRSLGRIWREPQNAKEIADERLTALDQAGVHAENPEEPR